MNVVVRADSSIDIGHGHVMRCLTIANYLDEMGHLVKFLCRELEGSLIPYIKEKGFQCDLYSDETKIEADLLMIDHYDLDEVWERKANKNIQKIFVIDDLNRKHDCSVLLDTTLGKTSEDYKLLAPKAKLFVGATFPVLRKEFILLREDAYLKRLDTQEVKKVLVSIGGTDHLNITKEIVSKLISHTQYQVKIVLSEKSQHFGELKSTCDLYNHLELVSFVENIHELIYESDIAIGAAGTSSYERAVLGLPTIMIQTAENQKFNIKAFSDFGIALTLEPSQLDQIDSYLQQISAVDSYRKLAMNAFDNVKPLGIFSVLTEISNQNSYNLKNANSNDIDQVFKWQSFPGARVFSRDKLAPVYEKHVDWFRKSLDNKNRKMFILDILGISLGFVRVDMNNEQNEVSIIISHGHYGQGLGAMALTLLRDKVQKIDLHAYIEDKNIASIRIFEKNGYKRFKPNWYINKG